MNKKLIKILACSACGLGFASSIPFAVTSCGSNNFVEKDLPIDGDDSVFDIDSTTNTLKGFKQTFLDHPENYKDCNTLIIPNTIKAISDYAFFDKEKTNNTTIPNYIKHIVFENGDKKSLDIGEGAFAFSRCEKLIFTGRIKSIGPSSFISFLYCKSIEFNGPADWFLDESFELNSSQFSSWRDNGEISVINGIDGQASSIKNKLISSDGKYSKAFITWTTKDVNPQHNYDPDQFDQINLPIGVLEIDKQTKTLNGFKEQFKNNPDEYDYCNTLYIPNSVTTIKENAFWNPESESTIPDYIENLVFQKGDNNLHVSKNAFDEGKFKRMVCARISQIDDMAFTYCDECVSIKFKGDTAWLSSITSAHNLEFFGWNTYGTIYCQDPTPDPENPYGAELAKEVLQSFTDFSHNNLYFWKTENWQSKK